MNKKGSVYFTFILTLIVAMVFFFGCAGANGVNGNDYTVTRKENDMLDKPWTIEDHICKFGAFEDLDTETELQILLFWHNRTGILPDYLDRKVCFCQYLASITEYCGTYKGYIVIEIYKASFIRPVVAPIIFNNYGYIPQDPSFHTVAWKDGKFYNLENLYNQNELTLEDIRNIARLHHRFVSGSYR